MAIRYADPDAENDPIVKIGEAFPYEGLCQTEFARQRNADGRYAQAIGSHRSARAAVRKGELGTGP
jgi:hypothetical protein